MSEFRFIDRSGSFYLRHWDGDRKRGDWVEEDLASCPLTKVSRARVATKVAVPVVKEIFGDSYDDRYDTLHQVVISDKAVFLVLTRKGTGFTDQDGEWWVSVNKRVEEELGRIRFGRIVWEPARLPR